MEAGLAALSLREATSPVHLHEAAAAETLCAVKEKEKEEEEDEEEEEEDEEEKEEEEEEEKQERRVVSSDDEDEPPYVQWRSLLMVFGTRKLLRRCFDGVFTNLTYRELCLVQAVCTCLRKNKDKVLEAGREKPPTVRASQLLRRPLRLMKKEYPRSQERARDALTNAIKRCKTKEVDRLCTRWYRCDAVLNESSHEHARIAASEGFNQSLHILIACGANVDGQPESRNPPLVAAVRHGKKKCLELLLDLGANINIESLYGETALCMAVMVSGKTNSACLHTLLKRGADVNFVGGKTRGTPLIKALKLHDPEIQHELVRTLLLHGADANLASVASSYAPSQMPLEIAVESDSLLCVKLLLEAGATDADGKAQAQIDTFKLHLSVEEGDLKRIRQLLKEGADINMRNEREKTPAWLATRLDRYKCLALLINQGADLNFADFRGSTPAHIAIMCKNESCLQLLIQGGADLNTRENNGQTPAHFACERNESSLLQLLAVRADFSITDDNGCTPARAACRENCDDCLDVLIGKGYDLAADVDEDGSTLLLAAAYCFDDSDCMQKLIEAGVDVNKQNNDGETAVHLVAMCDRLIDTLDCLLVNGASVNVARLDGAFPIHIASGGNDEGEYEAADCLELLLEHGATFDVPDGAGDTPLQIALENCHAKSTRLLLDAGARDEDDAAKKWLQNLDFCKAVRENDLEAARDVLAAGADLNNSAVTNMYPIEQTPVYIAASKGHKELLLFLLAKGARLDTLCEEQTALQASVAANEIECVDLLLRAGATDPDDEAKKWLAEVLAAENEEDYWGESFRS